MKQIIAIALLIATTLPVASSEYVYNIPPFKMTGCIGKLQLDGNSKSIGLDTQMMHGKKFNDDAIPCAAPLYKRNAKRVRDICEIDDICEIEGMIKGFSHDIYEWTRIDRVKTKGRAPVQIQLSF